MAVMVFFFFVCVLINDVWFFVGFDFEGMMRLDML